MYIHRAPVACRVRGHHIFIEGQTSFVEDDQLLEEVIARFGHLLTREPLTGQQWLQAIAQSSSPETLAHSNELVTGLRRIMLCDRFDGARHPTREVRVANALKEMEALGGAGHIQFDQPQESSSMALAALLDVPEGDALIITDPGSLLGRMQGLLAVRPVGPQLFTPGQGEDEEAQLAVIALLIKNHGYGSMLAERSPGQTWGQSLQPPLAMNLIDAFGPKAALNEFFLALVRSGWDGTGSVYLSRRAPVYNPLASIQPYESLVHRAVIGWRLPQEFVDRQTLAARATVESVDEAQSHQPRRSVAEV